MILRNLTIILFIISIICIVLGKVIKKNKVCMLGYGIIVVIIIFWIVFFIYALSENDKELENQNIVYGNENFKSEITNNRNEIDDLTFKMQNETCYKYGQVYKVNDKKIYFIDKEENKYSLENNDKFNYIDGRTGVKYSFDDIKESYYINVYNQDCYIFKNIKGEELKKELLISLSLSDEYNIVRTAIDNIQKIQQLGNNEAIVTIIISDLISPEYYPNSEKQSFEINVKFTNNTKYQSKGNYTYDASTIENSKDTIMTLKLDEKTLNYKYPEVLEFISSDS